MNKEQSALVWMCRRGLKTSPGLHFGTGFGTPEITASAGEPRLEKAVFWSHRLTLSQYCTAELIYAL